MNSAATCDDSALGQATLLLRASSATGTQSEFPFAGRKLSIGGGAGCTFQVAGQSPPEIGCLIVNGLERTVLRAFDPDFRLNGQLVRDCVLEVGDLFQIGDTQFEVLGLGIQPDGVPFTQTLADASSASEEPPAEADILTQDWLPMPDVAEQSADKDLTSRSNDPGECQIAPSPTETEPNTEFESVAAEVPTAMTGSDAYEQALPSVEQSLPGETDCDPADVMAAGPGEIQSGSHNENMTDREPLDTPSMGPEDGSANADPTIVNEPARSSSIVVKSPEVAAPTTSDEPHVDCDALTSSGLTVDRNVLNDVFNRFVDDRQGTEHKKTEVAVQRNQLSAEIEKLRGEIANLSKSNLHERRELTKELSERVSRETALDRWTKDVAADDSLPDEPTDSEVKAVTLPSADAASSADHAGDEDEVATGLSTAIYLRNRQPSNADANQLKSVKEPAAGSAASSAEFKVPKSSHYVTPTLVLPKSMDGELLAPLAGDGSLSVAEHGTGHNLAAKFGRTETPTIFPRESAPQSTGPATKAGTSETRKAPADAPGSLFHSDDESLRDYLEGMFRRLIKPEDSGTTAAEMPPVQPVPARPVEAVVQPKLPAGRLEKPTSRTTESLGALRELVSQHTREILQTYDTRKQIASGINNVTIGMSLLALAAVMLVWWTNGEPIGGFGLAGFLGLSIMYLWKGYSAWKWAKIHASLAREMRASATEKPGETNDPAPGQ